MTLDFRLEQTNNTMTSTDGYYKFAMDSTCGNEIPQWTTDYAEIHNQTLALFATINKGQLTNYPSFGVSPRYKNDINQVGQSKANMVMILEELSSMIYDYFLDNVELQAWAAQHYSILKLSV